MADRFPKQAESDLNDKTIIERGYRKIHCNWLGCSGLPA